MSTDAYENLIAQARDWLTSQDPRPTTEEVAWAMLVEIAEEFGVPEQKRDDFAERLLPGLVHVVSTARSQLVRQDEEEAGRAYRARNVTAPWYSRDLLGKHMPLAARSGADDQHGSEAQHTDVVRSAPGSGVRAISDAQATTDAPTPAAGGQSRRELQVGTAALPDSERTAGDQTTAEAQMRGVAPSAPVSAAIGHPEPIHVTLPTPLTQRQEVLDGWRGLRHETIFVPEHGEVSYGQATVPQIDLAIDALHAVARESVNRAVNLRGLKQMLTESKVACLDDLLTGREP